MEKLSIAPFLPEQERPLHNLTLEDLSGNEIESVDMAAPHSFMIVKGWTRMFCAYTVLLCCYQVPGFREARLLSTIISKQPLLTHQQ